MCMRLSMCVRVYIYIYTCIYINIYVYSCINLVMQAQDIARQQFLAGMPEMVSAEAVKLLDTMVCEGEGEPPLIRDRNVSSQSVVAGGSSLQGPVQTKLTNEFYLEVLPRIHTFICVCTRTCIHICTCSIYVYVHMYDAHSFMATGSS